MSPPETSVLDPASRADDPLGPLEGLIGDWVSEAGAAPGGAVVSRTISYSWLFGRKFVRAESERRSGQSSVKMEITYLWDPSARAIRSRILSSDGSSSDADVETADGAVILKARSVSPDGTASSMTSTLSPVDDDDTRTETWPNIRVGDRSFPDAPPIVWRRR